MVAARQSLVVVVKIVAVLIVTAAGDHREFLKPYMSIWWDDDFEPNLSLENVVAHKAIYHQYMEEANTLVETILGLEADCEVEDDMDECDKQREDLGTIQHALSTLSPESFLFQSGTFVYPPVAAQFFDELIRCVTGAVNHKLYFQSMMDPKGEDSITPDSELFDLVTKQFGSEGALKERVQKEFMSLDGDGWVWFVLTPSGSVDVISTTGEDNPLLQGHFPLLAIDAWEHAYAGQYGRDKLGYFNALWELQNWAVAEYRFTYSPQHYRGDDPHDDVDEREGEKVEL